MLAFAERLLSAVRTPGYWRRLVAHMARRAGGGGSGRVRDAAELSASEVQVPGDLFVRFGARVVINIMRTHPVVTIGGVLQENPFYVPPDQFLPEIRKRRTSSQDRKRVK